MSWRTLSEPRPRPQGFDHHCVVGFKGRCDRGFHHRPPIHILGATLHVV
ncbi:MAG: hypothetical protein IGR92_18845 [Leptolyngbyaceae cyanobacterium T60_A2020_046]|nr:hypothetical protein [Leptolyngbyaceae cyanobacterium T60_A2020_046]